jgi:hypothetical protein
VQGRKMFFKSNKVRIQRISKDLRNKKERIKPREWIIKPSKE